MREELEQIQQERDDLLRRKSKPINNNLQDENDELTKKVTIIQTELENKKKEVETLKQQQPNNKGLEDFYEQRLKMKELELMDLQKKLNQNEYKDQDLNNKIKYLQRQIEDLNGEVKRLS